MIPTLLLVGLVLGKWWRVVIPAAAIGSAVLLMVHVDSGFSFAASAALLGAINVTVGVIVFQATSRLLRTLFMSRGEAAKPQ